MKSTLSKQVRLILQRTVLLCVYFNVFSACEDQIRTNLVCDPGYYVDESGEQCIRPDQYKTCFGSDAINEVCLAQNRACIDISATQDSICSACLPGFKEINQQCIPVVTCEELACEQSQKSCNPALDHFDAECGDCLEGFTFTDGVCSQPSCDPTDINSLYNVCLQQNKLCDESILGCGDCLPGYRSFGANQCEKILTCEAIKKSECDPQRRGCFESSDPTMDSYCGECIDGYEEVDGACLPIPPAATCDDLVSTLNQMEQPQIWTDYCLSLRRVCQVINRNPSDVNPGEPSTETECGDCLEGYALDPETGRCTEIVPCDVLGCDRLNRECEEGASIECGLCLEGYTQDIEDPASCRELITCDDLNCAELGTSCTPAGVNSDAYCEVNCGQRAVFNGRECTPCPPCQGDGENGISRRLTEAGYCICNTAIDHFYSTSGEIGTFPCDADEDGWLRENTRIAMESDDPILREQAKCTLQKIHSIKLINEKGQEKLIPLSEPVGLYETLRNDDQLLLEGFWSGQDDQLQLSQSRALQASALNRFTKLCFERGADFNDNGLEDVSEWGDMATPPTMRSEQSIFNEYSYFAEIHNGYFEVDPTFRAPLDSEGEVYGVYVIKERSRTTPTNGFEGIQLNSEGRENKYWRECTLEDDRGWGGTVPDIGLDFSGETTDDFEGMKLHSLFKCLYVTDAPDDEIPTHRTPQGISRYDGLINDCEPIGVGSATSDLRVSDRFSFECNLVPASSAEGVVWTVEPYEAYFESSSYKRGCVNECSDTYDDCSGQFVTCLSDRNNFGKKLGCEEGEICDGDDNDNDGRVDEDLPRNFLRCQTSLPGRCAEGRILCLPQLDDTSEYAEVCVMDEQLNDIDTDTLPPFRYCSPGSQGTCVTPQLRLGFSLSDIDRDGVIEAQDNCPGVPNPSQSDQDYDGLGDICDREQANYPDSTGRAPLVISNLLDSDQDGTYDYDDECPLVAGVSCEGDEDGDGFRAGDTCPERYTRYNVDSDNDGEGNACDPEAVRPLQDFKLTELNLSPETAQFIADDVSDPRPYNYYQENPDHFVEFCNGFDDDCDGRIDEGPIYDDPNNALFPYSRDAVRLVKGDGFGESCTVADTADQVMEGICKEGHFACDGGVIECIPDYDVASIFDRSGRRGEIGDEACDNLDNDCDGQTDEPDEESKFMQGSAPLCVAPHKAYFIDYDEDSYGVNGVSVCACDQQQALLYASDNSAGSPTSSYYSSHPETRRVTRLSQLTSRSGDCCDIRSDARPNRTWYTDASLPAACQRTGLTHDWNCDGNNEDEGIGIDTSLESERRAVLNDLVGSNWRWTRSAQYYTENNYNCYSFVWGIQDAVRRGGGTDYYERYDHMPLECVKMWQRQAPSNCGERHYQLQYIIFNLIAYALPLNPRYTAKRCR